MTTETIDLPVRYDIAEAELARLESHKALVIQGLNDRGGYAAVHSARMEVKALRCSIENRRKELKADALEYGRKVDTEAKRLFSRLEPVEAHLEAEEKRIDDEKARIKREALEAEQARIDNRIAQMRELGATISVADAKALTDEEFSARLMDAEFAAAEECARKAAEESARKAEEIRLAKVRAEQEAEAKRLKEEREKIEAEKNAEAKRAHDARKAEEARIAAERKALDDERKALEAERKAEQDRKDREAREAARIALEAKQKAEREAAEKVRAEADEKHREEVLLDATAAIVGILGGTEVDLAARIVHAIEVGLIPHVRIEF